MQRPTPSKWHCKKRPHEARNEPADSAQKRMRLGSQVKIHHRSRLPQQWAERLLGVKTGRFWVSRKASAAGPKADVVSQLQRGAALRPIQQFDGLQPKGRVVSLAACTFVMTELIEKGAVQAFRKAVRDVRCSMRSRHSQNGGLWKQCPDKPR